MRAFLLLLAASSFAAEFRAATAPVRRSYRSEVLADEPEGEGQRARVVGVGEPVAVPVDQRAPVVVVEAPHHGADHRSSDTSAGAC